MPAGRRDATKPVIGIAAFHADVSWGGWTVPAAEATLRSCERHAGDAALGWEAITARVDEAIAGQWQGLNLENLAQQARRHADRPGRHDLAISPHPIMRL